MGRCALVWDGIECYQTERLACGGRRGQFAFMLSCSSNRLGQTVVYAIPLLFVVVVVFAALPAAPAAAAHVVAFCRMGSFCGMSNVLLLFPVFPPG